jgi:hypothetical protein
MTTLTDEQKAILNSEIANDPEGKGYAVFLSDQPWVVLDLMNGLTEMMVKSRIITARGILSDYPGGPAAAAAVLDKLDAAASTIPALKWAWKFISGEGLDIGSQATQGMLDQLATAAAGNVLTPTESANIKNLALKSASRCEVLGLPFMTNKLFASRQ